MHGPLLVSSKPPTLDRPLLASKVSKPSNATSIFQQLFGKVQAKVQGLRYQRSGSEALVSCSGQAGAHDLAILAAHGVAGAQAVDHLSLHGAATVARNAATAPRAIPARRDGDGVPARPSGHGSPARRAAVLSQSHPELQWQARDVSVVKKRKGD